MNKFFEKIKLFFTEKDYVEPEDTSPDMLEKLLEFDIYYDYQPAEYDSTTRNPYLSMIIDDYPNLGWCHYKTEMDRALEYDQGACRDILIKHMQTHPKRIEQPSQGLGMMFARSVGNSDGWHQQYEARQKVNDEQREERYKVLGLTK